MTSNHKSSESESGTLYLVAGPIGNLEDITFRAIRVLREVDLIAAEDTRRARILLQHYDIQKPLTSYHMHNESAKTADLLRQIGNGTSIALLSDAGTPSLSDPGYLLVRDALAAGIEPEIIPGPAALTFAVTACGLPVTDFHFQGFLPQKSGKRKRCLEMLGQHSTFFLYESPYRIHKLLTEIVEVLGSDTHVVLIREATKLHEERLRGSAQELLARHGERNWKGEFTIAVTCRQPKNQ